MYNEKGSFIQYTLNLNQFEFRFSHCLSVRPLMILISEVKSWDLNQNRFICATIFVCLFQPKTWISTIFCHFLEWSWVVDRGLTKKSLTFSSVIIGGYYSLTFYLQLHQSNWPPRYNLNIVESVVKHHNPKPNPY